MVESLMKLSELSNKLNIAKSTLYNYVKTNNIPFIKLGGQLLFSENAIEKWILNNTHNTNEKGTKK
jgi:excisionase family DNA binding protein